MELRLKDKEQALRVSVLRQKELMNIIESHKRLVKAERQKN